MPIYEYVCKDCGKELEILMRSADQKPVCPCGSSNLDKKFSVFAVSEASAGTVPGCAQSSCGYSSGACGSGLCGLQ